MGWSEATAIPELSRIFKHLKLKYTMRRVQQASGTIVMIEHEGEIDIPSVRKILGLFPDFVYVEFVPNSNFVESNVGDRFDGSGHLVEDKFESK